MPAKSILFEWLLILSGGAILYFKISHSVAVIGWPNAGIIAILLIIIAALYFFFKPLLKKRILQWLLLVICFAAAILLPYGYLYGLIDFKRTRDSQEHIVHDFNRGGFDSLLTVNPYKEKGVRLSARKDHFIDIYADSTLRMVFFFKHTHNADHCGDLFISNPKYITDKRLVGFLHSDFEYRQLNTNWFWIETFTVIKPFSP